MAFSTDWLMAGVGRATIGLAVSAVLVATCVRLLRLRAPRAEQLVWFLVLAQGLVLVPLALPASYWLAGERTDLPTPMAASIDVEPVGVAPTVADASRSVEQAIPGHDIQPGYDEVRHDTVVSLREIPKPWPDWTWRSVCTSVWLFGITACLVVGAARYGGFVHRLKSTRPAPSKWRTEWQALLTSEQIRRDVPLFVSQEIGPALVRTWSGYRVVVPKAIWLELSETERTTILRHEAMHLKRGDLWRSLAARCLAIVHWFNPAAWWAIARFEAQAEYACDEAAAQVGAVDYATTLVRLAARGRSPVVMVRWMSAGDLLERTKRLVDQSPVVSWWRCSLPVLLTLVVLATNGLRFRAVADEPNDAPVVDTKHDGAEPTSLPPRGLVRLGRSNLLASSSINALAFSPDGKQVAAALLNNSWPAVPLFDVATGRRVRLLSDPTNKPGWVAHVAFSPNGTRLVGSTYTDVLVWDLTTGALLFREQAHPYEIADVQYSPDGRLIASASSDGTVLLRKADNPAEIVRKLVVSEAPARRDEKGPISTGGGGISCFAFTSDGTRIVVGIGRSGDLSIWDVADGKRLRTISKAHGGGTSYNPRLNCVAVSPDGRYFMSAGQHQVKREQTKLKYGPKNVTLTQVRLWSLKTGERLRDLAGDEDYGFGFAGLSPDRTRVAIADFGRLTIRETDAGKVEHTIALPGSWGRPPVFSPDGKILAMPLENSVGLFDVRTGHRLQESEGDFYGTVVAAAWSTTGDRIVTGHTDGFVRSWDVMTGRTLWKHELAPVISASGWPANPAYVAFSTDGRQVIAAGRRDDPVKYEDGIVAVLDAKTGTAQSETFLDEVRCAVLAPDGARVIAATNHGGIHETRLHGIDVRNGRLTYTEPPQDVRIGLWDAKVMRFQADSKTMWIASGDGGIAQFDAASGKQVRKFIADWRTPEQIAAGKPSYPDLWEAAFSADCRTMVSSSREFIYVWDVAEQRMRLRIRHPHDHGCKICLAPDGKTMATSDLNYAGDPGENTVGLYELETGKVVLSLEPGDDRAGVLAFSPDGSKLFTGFHRGTAMIWDVRR
jgi:WD40 repeat protein/beta-lactamase regulating signal transducer with metallopeptidase domain